MEATQNKKILVVDDLAVHRNQAKSILEKYGFLIDTAEDGIDALYKLSKCSYDVIITDIEMPNMNGFELLSKLKKTLEYIHIPVVVLSSRDKDKDIRRAKKLKADYYITKPITNDEFLNALSVVGLINT